LPVQCENTPFNALFVEVKAPGTGTLSDDQKRVSQLLLDQGNSVQVCVSVEAAWANLLWHIRPQLIWPPRSERFAGHPASDHVERIRREVADRVRTIDQALAGLNYSNPLLKVDGWKVESGSRELWHCGPSADGFADFVNRCSRGGRA
jgi:hypothetical protein